MVIERYDEVSLLKERVNQVKDQEKLLKEKAQKMIKQASKLTGVRAPDQLPPEISEVSYSFKLLHM